jgi:hypothetical protein
MVQKQINNFVQINCTDNFSTVDVTTRLLMDFGCVPGDQKKLIHPDDICVFYNDDCESGFILDDDQQQFG